MDPLYPCSQSRGASILAESPKYIQWHKIQTYCRIDKNQFIYSILSLWNVFLLKAVIKSTRIKCNCRKILCIFHQQTINIEAVDLIVTMVTQGSDVNSIEFSIISLSDLCYLGQVQYSNLVTLLNIEFIWLVDGRS